MLHQGKLPLAFFILFFLSTVVPAQENNVYQKEDAQPEFPGGTAALYDFIQRNITYPKEAIKAGISGTVYVRFTVMEDGSLHNLTVTKGIGGGCDEEALRILKKSPNWVPVRYQGKAISTNMTVPFHFQLDNN